LTCEKALCYQFFIKIQYDACYMRDAMVNFRQALLFLYEKQGLTFCTLLIEAAQTG